MRQLRTERRQDKRNSRKKNYFTIKTFGGTSRVETSSENCKLSIVCMDEYHDTARECVMNVEVAAWECDKYIPVVLQVHWLS